jgi:monofunctional biosynthetic peptidoglycan transglycosylase
MTIYLNVVEWGRGVFGAEAAARHYFKRSARQLTLRQAALLTASLPNPRARDPARPSRALQAAAARSAARAEQAGDYIKCLYP